MKDKTSKFNENVIHTQSEVDELEMKLSILLVSLELQKLISPELYARVFINDEFDIN